MQTPKLTDRQAFWLTHYDRCIAEKQTYHAYCQTHNLSADAFAYARRALVKHGAIKSKRPRKKPSSTGFVSVKPGVTVKSASEAIALSNNATLLLPNKVRIEVPSQVLSSILPILLFGAADDTSR